MAPSMPSEPDPQWLIFCRKQEQERDAFNTRVKDAERVFLARQEKEARAFWKKQACSAATEQRDVALKTIRGGVGTAQASPGKKTVAAKSKSTTAKPSARKMPRNVAQEIIDLCSDDENGTTAGLIDEPRFGSVVPKEVPAFRIPTATLELFGTTSTKYYDPSLKSRAKKGDCMQKQEHGTSAPKQLFASSGQQFGDGSVPQSPGTSSQASSVVPQPHQGSPLGYSPFSSSTSTGPAENGGTTSTPSMGPSYIQATTAAMFGPMLPLPTSSQGIYADQVRLRHAITRDHSFHGLPSDWSNAKLPPGQELGSTERMLDVVGGQSGLEESTRKFKFSTHRTSDEQPNGYMGTVGDELSRKVTDTCMKYGIVSSPSTGYAKQSQRNPPACLDQLPTPSPSSHSPVIATTPSTPSFCKPSQPTNARKPNGRIHGDIPSSQTPAPRTASTISHKPDRSPRTPTKRKIFHNLSSSSDEEDLYKPSDDEDEDEDYNGPNSSKTARTPTKTPIKPIAKKPRVLNPSTLFTTTKLNSSFKPIKNAFGFKPPLSKPPSKPKNPPTATKTTHPKPPRTPSKDKQPSTTSPTSLSASSNPAPRTPSHRRAKLTAQKRNQAYITQLDRSTSPSETSANEAMSRNADVLSEGDDVLDEQQREEEHHLQTSIRHLSITPAPSTISAADSTSARSRFHGNPRVRERERWRIGLIGRVRVRVGIGRF